MLDAFKNNGVIKYSVNLCPNYRKQSELFGRQAYKELKVVEFARDGKNSQTQLCFDKKIKVFSSWEVIGQIIVGMKSLKELCKLTGYRIKKSDEALFIKRSALFISFFIIDSLNL